MIMEIILSVTLLFIGIAALIVIHICVVGRAFRGDFFNARIPISVPSRTVRIPSMRKEDIKELPCFDYKVEEKGTGTGTGNGNGNGDWECAVCLENFKNGEKCRILPKCNHSFHCECIDSWLLKTAVCPICRACVGSLSIEQVQNRSHAGEIGVDLV